ncbi:MAG TPA: alpha/beta hydrolase [Gemmatimonadaceae bacterium]|nr:alpha/beta hydrolase [Gemmatimonadaceae bacterium]
MERFGHGGRPVVLVHGFPTSSFLWRAIAPRLAEAGHTALALDLLGYGESDRPLEGDYSIAAQAEHIDRVLTALRIPSATIVGIDAGGGIAQRLAVTRPARVSALMLINSVGFDECPARDVKVVQHETARFAFRLSQGMLGAAQLLRRVLEGSVAERERMPARLVARYLAPYVGADGVTHLLAVARALRAEDVADLALKTIAVPTTIVWGEADQWLDSGMGERLQGAIPGSVLVKLPGVARLVPEESPETLTQLIDELVQRAA